ncbi:MAG: hypothetical protein HUK04_04665 [Bacteroidaceae bacterium]|nr:hypothetical protein [Bacteroidaceae bacterium]
MQEVDKKIITSIGLYGIFKKLNDTAISDKNSIKKLIEKRDIFIKDTNKADLVRLAILN